MIPKLGLKHYNLLKDVKGPDENMKILADSICKNMSPADFDFACLHILEFNNKLKSEVEKDGFTYKLDDVYVCQRTEFQFQGNTFYFRPPGKFEQFATISEMLSNCLIMRLMSETSKPAPNAILFRLEPLSRLGFWRSFGVIE